MREVAVLALVIGCYHGSTPAPAPPARPAASSHARTAADPLGFLPSDASVVAHLDTVQLRGSALWVRLAPSLAPRLAAVFEPFQAACGFDPLPQMSSLTLAIRDAVATTPETVVVIRGLERPRVMPCIERLVTANPAVARLERGVVLRVAPGETPVAFTFADARTLVVLRGPRAASSDPLRELLQAGAPLRDADPFMALHARLETSRAAWFVADSPPLFASLRALGHDVRALYGSLDVTLGASAKLYARMGDAAGAANLVSTLQAQITAAQAIVDRLEVSAEDDVVAVDLALTDDQVLLVSGVLLP